MFIGIWQETVAVKARSKASPTRCCHLEEFIRHDRPDLDEDQMSHKDRNIWQFWTVGVKLQVFITKKTAERFYFGW